MWDEIQSGRGHTSATGLIQCSSQISIYILHLYHKLYSLRAGLHFLTLLAIGRLKKNGIAISSLNQKKKKTRNYISAWRKWTLLLEYCLNKYCILKYCFSHRNFFCLYLFLYIFCKIYKLAIKLSVKYCIIITEFFFIIIIICKNV